MGGTAVASDDEIRVPLGEFARRVSTFVSQAKQQPLTVTKNGRPVAVLVDFDVFRKLTEMEEKAEDLYWTVMALRQEVEWVKAGRPTVPLEEVEARRHVSD